MTSFRPRIDAATNLCCVIGDPVGHSLSPAMQNAAFKSQGLNVAYLAFSVSPADLGKAVQGLRSLGFLGANVTIPHKVSVMGFLDEVDSKASKVGAVNTILNRGGKLMGTNTDVDGIMKPIEKRGLELKGGKAVLLGAGGAARAVLVALSLLSLRELSIHGRTLSKAEELAKRAGSFGMRGRAYGISSSELKRELGSSNLLINSTPVGMHPNVSDCLVPEDSLGKGLIVFDLVYNPLKTTLIERAERAGATAIPGYEMLVHQGAASFKVWTDMEAPVEIMTETVLEGLRVMSH